MPSVLLDKQSELSEVDRIQKEYEYRDRTIPEFYYSLTNPTCYFRTVQRTRAIHQVLKQEGMLPLKDKRICDIGCGKGDWLVDFEAWGAQQHRLYGIDLDCERVQKAKQKLPKAEIRLGNAETLPWPDENYDLVVQATLFTSILDEAVKRKVADEMMRILKPHGIILWYDFRYNNPKNPNVRGIEADEISCPFKKCKIQLYKVTLAPPIVRRMIKVSWILCLLLEKIPVLRTHYIGVMRKI